MIVDTGSSHTIFSPDVLEAIGVMDGIEIGDFLIKNMEVDVGVLPKEHNGLLGLDILEKNKYIIDMDKLELYRRYI